MSIFRRFLSSRLSRASRAISTNSSNEPQPKFTLISKFGFILGLTSLPVVGFVIYDRLADLPEELRNLNFPLPARFFIRRALCTVNSLEETAKYLDNAMQKVMASGIGSASPESTALVLYLARLYLEGKDVNVKDLEAAHYALTFKPHVGEAVREEIARIDFSFKVADRLCSFYSSNGHEDKEKVQFYANKSLALMENGPNYLKSQFQDHPLNPKFKQFSSNFK